MSAPDKTKVAVDRIFHEEKARTVFWNDPEKRGRSDLGRRSPVGAPNRG
jgi:hypothetical protein